YAAELAARGFVTASIRYRQGVEGRWPSALEDAKRAVRWMRTNAGEIGLDPGRLAVAGASAGGQLAAMVGSTSGRFEGSSRDGEDSTQVAAAILWYPQTDLRLGSRRGDARRAIRDFLGDPRRAREASPVTYAAEAPPTLTFTGDRDPAVPLAMVNEYHALLDRHGVPNRLIVFPGVGHSFDYNPARWRDCFEEMLVFLHEHVACRR
ncbi:MAG: alpha/beta hydrolase, partial [Actinomycetota bacterium]